MPALGVCFCWAGRGDRWGRGMFSVDIVAAPGTAGEKLWELGPQAASPPDSLADLSHVLFSSLPFSLVNTGVLHCVTTATRSLADCTLSSWHC